jgi:hypothetical protein
MIWSKLLNRALTGFKSFGSKAWRSSILSEVETSLIAWSIDYVVIENIVYCILR